MLEKLLKEVSKRNDVPFADVRKEFFAQYRIFKKLYPYAAREHTVRYIAWTLDRKYQSDKKSVIPRPDYKNVRY